MHVDKHVVKMVLEYSQMLCTAHRLLDGSQESILYRATHTNHPCARWTREFSGNYEWLHSLLVELLTEYTHRYDRVHKVRSSGLESWLYQLPANITAGPMTSPALAMPDEFKRPSAIESYRFLYAVGKRHLHSWTRREVPDFRCLLPADVVLQ